METAVKLARLNVVRMLNDNEAVAFDRGMHWRDDKHDDYIMVIDVGGGSFKAEIWSKCEGMLDGKCVGGDESVSGIEIDKEVVEYCAQ